MPEEKKDLTLGERAVNWAKAMGIIHHEPGVVSVGHRCQFPQRRDVSIHAENPVGHD